MYRFVSSKATMSEVQNAQCTVHKLDVQCMTVLHASVADLGFYKGGF